MDISDTIKLKKCNMRVSKNSKYWYRTALSYDHENPEANFAYACELEQKGDLANARKYFKMAYDGGLNLAIVGLSRVEKNLRSGQPEAEPGDKSKKKWLIVVLLLLILGTVVIYFLINTLKERDIYKVYNIRESETRIVEQNVWVHRIPIAPDLAGEAGNKAIDKIKISSNAEVKDIIVSSEEYAKKNNFSKNGPLELFIYYNNLSGSALESPEPVAKASLVNGNVTDIYLYPGFKKKALS